MPDLVKAVWEHFKKEAWPVLIILAVIALIVIFK